MDLRQLQYVSTVARYGSFIRAAQELHITQPTLTRSIQNIERQLGTKLFDRGPRGVKPTPEGGMVIDVAEQYQSMLSSLRHNIKLSEKGHLGEVNFGLGPTVGAIFLSDVLTELINHYPRVSVNAYVNNADQLRDSLLAENIEFAIQAAGLLDQDPRIVTTLLGELPLSFFVRAGHPLTKKKNVTQKDVSAFPVITGNTPKLIKSRQSKIWHQIAAKSRLNCDDSSALKRVTLSTDAVWRTSYAMIAKECLAGTLVEISHGKELHNPTLCLEISSLVGRNLSPTAKLTIQLIRQLYQRIVQID